MKQVNTPKYIIVLGTTYSGSGAVFDYLNGRGEFYNPLKSIEYQLPHMPNGLMALEAVASSSFHPGTADYVLHNFEKNIKKLLRSNSIWTYGRSYEKFIPTFQSAIDEFVSEICEVNIQMNLNWHRLMQSPINYIISQIKNFFGIKNYVPLTHILVSEDKLVYAAQKFHDKIFLRNANNRPVLLNQAGSGWNPIKSTKYFLNCKIILVTRDPRDQYLEIKQKKKTNSVMDFISWYKEMSKRLNNIKNENLFLIRFEDFIYNNDKMINILCDFLSIPKNTYSNFKPEESKLNIGKYNEFLTKKEIKIIENNLTSDLFNK